MLTLSLVLAALASAAAVPAAPPAPYTTASQTFTLSTLDKTNQHIDVVYPVAHTQGQKFPLIAYSHGFDDDGYASYKKLFNELAGWGFVVAIPLACKFGCESDCKNLVLDPPCFGNYYRQQLAVIDWAMTRDDLPINGSYGVGVAGHSMGGQSSLFSAAYNATTHNIKAVALHHAFTHTFPAIATVPFITFTGTNDDIAPSEMAVKTFNAQGAFGTRSIVNKKGADHHEPTTHYNPMLSVYTVAWFKFHLQKTAVEFDVNFEEEIYGNSSTSICNGGDGAMELCTMLR